MRKKEIVCFSDVHSGAIGKSEMKKQVRLLRKKLHNAGVNDFAFTVTDTPLQLDNKVDNVSR